MAAFDQVRVDEPGRPGVLVDGHPRLLELLAQRRVGPHLGGDLTDAIHQPRVVEGRFTGGDAVAGQLSGLADQPGRMGQGAHRDRPVGGGRSAQPGTGDQRRSGSQPRRPQRRDHTGRAPADDHHIEAVLARGGHPSEYTGGRAARPPLPAGSVGATVKAMGRRSTPGRRARSRAWARR